MKRKSFKYRRVVFLVGAVLLGYLTFNAISIYNYSSRYSEEESDAAIVLGAGTSNGKISQVFKERINHAMYLYNKKIVTKIILTGGYGAGQKRADSEVAKIYLIAHGIPDEAIRTEKISRFTIENLIEAKRIMDSVQLRSALIVTDPLHMKRSMKLAENLGISCKPSPTRTTMYRSIWPKAKSLAYETFYYSLGEIAGKN